MFTPRQRVLRIRQQAARLNAQVLVSESDEYVLVDGQYPEIVLDRCASLDALEEAVDAWLEGETTLAGRWFDQVHGVWRKGKEDR